jgi:hypothetical protein
VPTAWEELHHGKEQACGEHEGALCRQGPSQGDGPQGCRPSVTARELEAGASVGTASPAGGTTIAGIMQSTGWLQHSVRGFFAGVARRKLGLNLESEKRDGERIYRIIGKAPSGSEARSGE